MEKFTLFMVLLNAALLSGNSYLHLFLILFICSCFLAYKLEFLKLIRLIALPFGFIVLGSISIAFSLHANPKNCLICYDAMGLCIGLEEAGINKAFSLFVKAIAAIMSLNYLILSCSLSEINDIGRRLRIPLILRELFVLTYRYISLLFSFTNQVHISQRNRLGYVNRKRSILSIGMLFSSVFIKSLLFSNRSLEALQSRGYDGEFYFRQQEDSFRLKQLVLIVSLGFLLVSINYFSL